MGSLRLRTACRNLNAWSFGALNANPVNLFNRLTEAFAEDKSGAGRDLVHDPNFTIQNLARTLLKTGPSK